MKKIILAAIIAATGLTSCNNGQPKANLKSDIDTLSYEMGMAMSQSEGEFQNYLSQSGSDSAYVDELLKGYIDGMEAAREIRTFDTAADIVFLTASPGFAYESYGVRALEYLLKPVKAELLYPVLDGLLLREKRPQDGLTLKTGGALIRVPFSQLAYVEVNGKHLYFNMADGSVREISGSMKDYETLLLARREFAKVHRSYIVNMLQIEKLSAGCVRTFSGAELPVSRLIYPQLQKDYMELLFADRWRDA